MTSHAEPSSSEHLLCSLAITEPGVIEEAGLLPQMFGDPWCEELWRIMSDRQMRGLSNGAMDLVPILNANRGLPGMDGAWLSELIALRPAVDMYDIHHLVQNIRQRSMQRALLGAGTRITQLASTVTPEEVEAALEIARSEVEACFTDTGGLTFASEHIGTVIANLTEEARKPIPTPWMGLNRLIHGWQGGRLYTFAAASGAGKSLMALNTACGLVDHGLVAFSSLEMTVEECLHRIMANEANIALDVLTNPPVNEAVLRQLDRHADRLGFISDRLAIDDRPNVTIHDIEHHARSVAKRGPLVAVIVDYIQVVKWHGAKSVPKREQLAEMSWRLKALSKELQVPVFQLCQVNRVGQQRENGEPTMNDLRDSADLENNSDVIVMMWQPDPDDKENLMMKTSKARGWPVGKWPVRRVGAYARIDNSGRDYY